MKNVGIIQARMGSTRLPGKVLMPLGGTSVLGCVVDRLRACAALDEIVVATSMLSGDDAVVAEAERLGVAAVRGSADDVLARFADAAHRSDADVVVRITSDCPLIDGELVDAMLHAYAAEPCDYLSNTIVRTYPRGLDAEIFPYAALERAHLEARAAYEREHVTPYFYGHPELFALQNYADPAGTDRSHLRWTLDTAEDYEFLRRVYEMCEYTRPRDVTMASVLRVLDEDVSLLAINAGVRQKNLVE
jgi:spore coat polysaccharide biosynthesis protein SpsF